MILNSCFAGAPGLQPLVGGADPLPCIETRDYRLVSVNHMGGGRRWRRSSGLMHLLAALILTLSILTTLYCQKHSVTAPCYSHNYHYRRSSCAPCGQQSRWHLLCGPVIDVSLRFCGAGTWHLHGDAPQDMPPGCWWDTAGVLLLWPLPFLPCPLA